MEVTFFLQSLIFESKVYGIDFKLLFLLSFLATFHYISFDAINSYTRCEGLANKLGRLRPFGGCTISKSLLIVLHFEVRYSFFQNVVVSQNFRYFVTNVDMISTAIIFTVL